MPGAEDLIIQIRTAQDEDGGPGVMVRRSYRNDDVTSFLRRVRDLALNGLLDDIKPEKKADGLVSGVTTATITYGIQGNLGETGACTTKSK